MRLAIETLPQEFGYRAPITLATDELASSAPDGRHPPESVDESG